MLIDKKIYWLLWLAFAIGLSVWLGMPLVKQEQQQMYLVGETTHGHHQIEMECVLCHTEPFGGREVLQDACVSCHGEELKAISDSHPKSKFTDPRNADRIEILDARYCITCHREHQEGITQEMGVTLPDDYCFSCHQDIGEERETHKDLAFDTCASSGCHNYHDNLALYENFLLEHAHNQQTSVLSRQLSNRNLEIFLTSQQPVVTNVKELAIPQNLQSSQAIDLWHDSTHAHAGVTCTSCHSDTSVDASHNGWLTQPGSEPCMNCHIEQSESFALGKHGMRIKAGLSAMKPAMARLTMKADASHIELGCTSCHTPHDIDNKQSAYEACIGCHDSQHVRNFEQSPHGQLTQQALLGEIPWQQAVTCATCHMPGAFHKDEISGENIWRINHNQNDNLRPNEKMIRSVCMDCHSLAFSIDSLADEKLINNNFTGLPDHHVPSIDMAIERDKRASANDDSYR